MLGVFSGFLFILIHILLDLFSLRSAEAYTGWGRKLNCHFDGKLCQNYLYQKLLKSFKKLQSKLSGMFFETQCTSCVGVFSSQWCLCVVHFDCCIVFFLGLSVLHCLCMCLCCCRPGETEFHNEGTNVDGQGRSSRRQLATCYKHLVSSVESTSRLKGYIK